MTVRDDTPFSRNELTQFLNGHRISTRNLFAGNLVRQPYMIGRPFRTASPLTNTDRVMNQTFWIGVFPGLSDAHIDHVLSVMHEFVKGRALQ
jgi:CDP-6-deoxy-D-xylo-4-hexulose-3-dehydrase